LVKDERSRVAFGLLAARLAGFTEEERDESLNKAFFAAISCAEELGLLTPAGDTPVRSADEDEPEPDEVELEDPPNSLLMLTS